MPKSIILKNKQEFLNQYSFFKTVHILGTLITWSYFSILLLRTAESPIEAVPRVIIYHGLVYAGLVFGFFISAKLIRSIGYLHSFRLSMFAQMVVTVIALIFLEQIDVTYIWISFLSGASRGIFWNTTHMFYTIETTAADRAKQISVLFSIQEILGVILPIMVGALLTYMGYPIVFIVGAILYFAATVYPWKFNKKPTDHLLWSDLVTVTKQPGFGAWTGLTIAEGITDSARGMVFAVLPFLFIGNEFGVGVLGTVVGLVSAGLSFSRRDDSYQNKFKQGLVGSLIIYTSTLALLVIWTLPVLLIRSVVAKIGFALYNPSVDDIKYHIRGMVVSDFKNKLGLEVQQIAEFTLFLGRIIGVAIFMVGLYVFGINIELMLMILVGISLVREPLTIMLSYYIGEDLKLGKHDHPVVRPIEYKPHGLNH